MTSGKFRSKILTGAVGKNHLMIFKIGLKDLSNDITLEVLEHDKDTVSGVE